MKRIELLSEVLFLLLVFGSPIVSYIIGRQDGKISERKAILERLEEVDSIHRQDSIKQQRNDKAIKQKIQVMKYKDGHKEYQINPYPESGYEPLNLKEVSFKQK